MAGIVVLHKVKRPGGTHSYDLHPLGADSDGVWLHAPPGSRWEAPHDRGTLPFHVLVLLAPERPWVTWWVDDPADRRVEVDVCLPPEPVAGGWRFVDLELDPIRHESRATDGDAGVLVDDRDEFAAACAAGHIAPAEAATALATAERVERALRHHDEPWGSVGWRRLRTAATSDRAP